MTENKEPDNHPEEESDDLKKAPEEEPVEEPETASEDQDEDDLDDLEIEMDLPDDMEEKPSGPPVHIIMDATARRQMIGHAITDLHHELGGMMIGSVREGETPTVAIEAFIPARYTDASLASLTFTQQTWADVHAVRERVYPDKKIIGWFHTHPGHSVFLSQYDLHIHENFFREQWHIAYVVDPVNRTEGLFRWEMGKVKKTIDYEVLGESEGAPSPFGPPAPSAVPPYSAVSWTADWRNYAVIGLALLLLLLFYNFNTTQKSNLTQIENLKSILTMQANRPAEIQYVTVVETEYVVASSPVSAGQGEPGVTILNGTGNHQAIADSAYESEIISNMFDALPLPEDCPEYVVVAGDTLYEILEAWYPDTDNSRAFLPLIRYANNWLTNIDRIEIGDRIKLPGATDPNQVIEEEVVEELEIEEIPVEEPPPPPDPNVEETVPDEPDTVEDNGE